MWKAFLCHYIFMIQISNRQLCTRKDTIGLTRKNIVCLIEKKRVLVHAITISIKSYQNDSLYNLHRWYSSQLDLSVWVTRLSTFCQFGSWCILISLGAHKPAIDCCMWRQCYFAGGNKFCRKWGFIRCRIILHWNTIKSIHFLWIWGINGRVERTSLMNDQVDFYGIVVW